MADPELHAAAVVAALNDPVRNWTMVFEAVQANIPEGSVEGAVEAPLVFVCGRAERLEKAMRGDGPGLRLIVTTTVDVGFFKQAANLAAEVDALKAQTKAIARYFIRCGRLPARPAALVKGVARQDYFNVDQLQTAGLYASTIALTIVEEA